MPGRLLRFLPPALLLGLLHAWAVYPGWLFYDSAQQWLWADAILHRPQPDLAAHGLFTQWPVWLTFLKVPFFALTGELGLFAVLQASLLFLVLFLLLETLSSGSLFSFVAVLLAAGLPVVFNYAVFHSADVLCAITLLAMGLVTAGRGAPGRKAALVLLLAGSGVLWRLNFVTVLPAALGYAALAARSLGGAARTRLALAALAALLCVPLAAQPFGAKRVDNSFEGSLLKLWGLYQTGALEPPARRVVEKYVLEPDRDFTPDSFHGMWSDLHRKVLLKDHAWEEGGSAEIKAAYLRQLIHRPLASLIGLRDFLASALGWSRPLPEAELGRRDVFERAPFEPARMRFDARREAYFRLHEANLTTLGGFFARPWALFAAALAVTALAGRRRRPLAFLLVLAASYYLPLIFFLGNHEFRYFFPAGALLLAVLHAPLTAWAEAAAGRLRRLAGGSAPDGEEAVSRPAATAPSGKPDRPAWERRTQWALFALFLVLFVGFSLRHVRWADEAQAWLIARDAPPTGLLAAMRYEGSPPLWHLLLMPLAKTLPFAALTLPAVALAGLSAWLILFRSPFPLLIRATLPFTFFLFYQYGLIARSYVLTTALTLAAAAHFESRFRRPGYWLVLLGLALSSIHGWLLACGMAGAGVLELAGRALAGRRQAAEADRNAPAPVVHETGAPAKTPVAAPADGLLAFGSTGAPPFFGSAKAPSSFGSPTVPPASGPTGAPPGPLGAAWSVWAVMAAFAVVVPLVYLLCSPPSDHLLVQGTRPLLPLDGETLLAILCDGLIGEFKSAQLWPGELAWRSPWSAVKVVFCLGFWLLTLLAARRSGRLAHAALPLLALAAGLYAVYANFYHFGLTGVAALYALWISLAAAPPDAGRSPWTGRLLLALLALVTARQTAWTADSLALEARTPYYGSLAAAQAVRVLGADRDIRANGFHVVALQPYFPANIFRNVQGDRAYFVWSWRGNYQKDRIDESRYLVSGPWGLIPPRGYVLVGLFPGLMPYKGRPAEEGTFALFRRAP